LRETLTEAGTTAILIELGEAVAIKLLYLLGAEARRAARRGWMRRECGAGSDRHRHHDGANDQCRDEAG
jgi:hypothetical protein